MALSNPSNAVTERAVDFAGQRLLVCSDAAEVIEAVDFLFAPHAVDTFADDWPRLEVQRAADAYCLLGSRGSASLLAQPDILEVSLSQVVLQRLVEHNDCHLMLHAAALECAGRGLLCVAAAGCGKTTLTGWLLGQGYRYLTDELVAINAEGTMRGVARPLNVKASGLDLIRGFPWLTDDLARARTSGQVTLIPRSDAWLSELPISAIVFPRFSANTEFTVETLSVGRCAASLMSGLLNARNLPKHGLTRVTALARHLPAFALRYSRLTDVSSWLERLLSGGSPVTATALDR
jgi:hypothetical protein